MGGGLRHGAESMAGGQGGASKDRRVDRLLAHRIGFVFQLDFVKNRNTLLFMSSARHLEEAAASLVENLFAELGGRARVRAAASGLIGGPDFWCDAELDGREITLAVHVRARYTAAEIAHSPALAQREALLVIPRLGPVARKHLKVLGVNHADLQGCAYLNAPGIRVDRQRQDRPARAAWSAPVREINPFSKKASRVLRALFSAPGESVRVSELAARTHLAIGWASNVADALVQRGYATRSEAGLRLADAVAALVDWTNAYQWRKNPSRSYAVPLDRDQVLERLSRECEKWKVPWALTLLAAAERRIGYVRGAGTVHVYLGGADDDRMRGILSELFAEESAAEGGLAIMEPYYGVGICAEAENVGGMRVVSDLQLFLDLAHFPVRGIEAAEMLLKRRMSKALRLDQPSVNRLLEGIR